MSYYLRKGIATFVGDDTNKIFTVEHELKIPDFVPFISPMSAEATRAYYQWDWEKLYFIFKNAPLKDIKLVFSWIVFPT